MIQDLSIFSSYEYLPTPLIIFSNEKVIYHNKKASELLELPKKIGDKHLNVFNYILPQYHKEIYSRNLRILKGLKVPPLNIEIKTYKKRIIHIETKSSVIKINGKKYIITLFFENTEQVLKNVELKNSKNILELIGKNNTDIIFKYDFEPAGKYTYISDSVKTILGYKPEQFYNNKKFYFNIIHPEDRLKIPADKKNYLAWIKKNNKVVLRYISKDKRIFWFETIYHPVKNNKGEIISISGISRNVTKEKETEDKLNIEKEKFELIANNANDIIYFYTYQPKPKYLYVSNSIEKLLGYKPDQLYKDPYFLSKRVVDKNNLLKQHDLISAKEQKSNKFVKKKVVYQVKNSNGESVWMEDIVSPVFENGRVSFLFGIVRNINELKQKEKELNQKWSDYKLLLDQSPIAFFIHHNGMCLMCNKAATELLKVKSVNDVIGKFIIDYIIPEQRSRAIERMKIATAGKEFEFLGYQINDSKGNSINVEIKTVPITYNGIDCVLSLVKDISERELYEKGRIKAELTEEHNKALLKEIELRKNAEKQLLDQKSKLTAIFENSSHLVWTINRKHQFTYFNINFENIFKDKYGVAPKLGKTSYELVPVKFKKNVEEFWKPNYNKAFNGEQIIIERSDFDSKNNAVYREIFLNPIYNESGSIEEISCMANDISENKKNQKQIVEQALRIQAIFNSGTQLMWTVDKNFRYTAINENFSNAMYDMAGIRPVIGEGFKSLKSNKTIDQFVSFWKEKYEEVLKGKSLEFVTERIDSSGNTVTRQFYINPIFNDNNEVTEIACIGKDITKQVNSERKLIDQSAKLNAIFEGSSHYIWTIDSDLKITSFNERYVELIKKIYGTNIRAGEKVDRGRMIKNIEFIGKLNDEYRKALNGESTHFEAKFTDVNNNPIYLDIYLNPIVLNNKISEISGIALDITERVLNQEQILEQNAKIQAIFESGTQMMWTINRKMELTSFNRNYAKALHDLYGFYPEINKSIRILSKGKTKPYDEFWDEKYSKAFGGEQQEFITERENLDGSKVIRKFVLYPIRNINGDVLEVSGLGIDITENRLNEERITQSLREKEVLLKEVHHRVKNNMQIISSILNLQSSYTNDEAILDLLKESQNRIKTMAYIHESLYQNKTFSSINFNEYLVQLTNNIIHSYSVSPNKIKLEINCEKLILNLDVSIPLGLIINELVTNSIKHAFPSSHTGKISINLRTQNNLVFLTVEDNGIGIDPNLNPVDSNSLGLQLVYTLIDQIDGKIKFERTAPSGTLITINFTL